MNKFEKIKECLHYWEWGWLGDGMIFCTKCNKDADTIYSKEDFCYSTHDCKDGNLIPRTK